MLLTGMLVARGKVGVCMVTSGPGATNLVTGIATAMQIVCLSFVLLAK